MQWSTEARRGGFVLMEAVIALSIIALVAVALLAATGAQVRTADKGALLLVSQALAEERMATLRSLGYDQLLDMPDSIAAGAFMPPFQEYTWQAAVTQLPDEYDLFGLSVVVNVADEAFSMNSVLHEPRPQGAAGTGGAPSPMGSPGGGGSGMQGGPMPAGRR
jgi:type II secretory pathway pseudopilin PulG